MVKASPCRERADRIQFANMVQFLKATMRFATAVIVAWVMLVAADSSVSRRNAEAPKSRAPSEAVFSFGSAAMEHGESVAIGASQPQPGPAAKPEEGGQRVEISPRSVRAAGPLQVYARREGVLNRRMDVAIGQPNRRPIAAQVLYCTWRT